MKTLLKYILLIISIISTVAPVRAFDLDTYASSSRLSSGRWVKISVSESGLYQITNAQLREWGFASPTRVRIYGYGGSRITDLLSESTYVDDLPPVQARYTDRGITFYGVGPEKWVSSENGRFHRESNIYANEGYYFLTDEYADEDTPKIAKQGVGEITGEGARWFYDRVHYELDAVSPGEAGWLLVGESFRTLSTRKFTLQTPDMYYTKGEEKLWIEYTTVTHSLSASSTICTVAGKNCGPVNITATTNSGYVHGTYTVGRHTVNLGGALKNVEVSIAHRGASSANDAWLDYISINYPRNLNLSGGYLQFYSSDAISLNTDGWGATVWDVTDPTAITELRTALDKDGRLTFQNDYHGMRSYVAFAPEASLPTPSYVGTVANQDLHSIETADMVIISPKEYAAQAQRIVEMHAKAARPLKVIVVNDVEIYNEFGSGVADVSAVRKFLKMMYDRGHAEGANPLRFCMLMSRPTFDHRHLTSGMQGRGNYPTIPCYMGGAARLQLSDNDAFGTDDFIAMLEDNSGLSLGSDKICIAVGRLPVRTISEAKSAIDKIQQYVDKSKHGTWRNSFMFLADDGDNGVHLDDTEGMINNLLSAPDNQAFITKVYVDTYDRVGGVTEVGRNMMFRRLEEGTMWWNYCGHANNHSWTGEGMLTYTDINSMYLKNVPIIWAFTCDFLRWDNSVISGGEILFAERNGGAAAMVSATRPVYISDNALYSKAVGRWAMRRDKDGYLLRIGEIYQNAKNNITNDKGEQRSNVNRLRYVLMGDPAMEMIMPSNIVRLESVDGVPVTEENQVTISARQQPVIAGSIYSPTGELLKDFNGVINLDIYDAEESTTTKGEGENNRKIVYDRHGEKLFSGASTVTEGRFEIRVPMPEAIRHNFRPGTVNMYAYDPTAAISATGINRQVYIFGTDESVQEDTEAPKIESMVLNHDSFRDGDKVNESPMMIAQISDNVGITISNAGVGRQMTLTLDGKKTYTDVADFYIPAADGSASGEISYPLEGLADGVHTLRLKIWDTGGNSTSKEIEFQVKTGLTPKIYDVYTDANPASTEANFYLSHNRPDQVVTVTLRIFNLLGQVIWETTSTGRSDMYLTMPITWNLTDGSGRRVQRGIYLYQAEISSDGISTATASRKLAVTAP